MSDYERLKEIIDEIDTLLEHHVTKSAPAFCAWYNKAERFLYRTYGSDSLELSAFQHTSFSDWSSDVCSSDLKSKRAKED